MTKFLNITMSDREYDEVMRVKADMTWKEFFKDIIKKRASENDR